MVTDSDKAKMLESSVSATLDLMELIKKMDYYLDDQAREEFKASLTEVELKDYQMSLW